MRTFLKSTAGKIVIGCVALALVAATVLTIVLLRPKDDEYRTIVVNDVSGTALVSNDKKQNTPAYAGMALFNGDTVAIADGGKLTMTLDGDKYLMAEGGTTFKLEASGTPGSDRTVIHLESGATLTRIKTKLDDDQSYVVKTPTATISVRGTVYHVAVEKNEEGKIVTKCNAFDGQVEVTPVDLNGTPTEAPQTISGGFSASVIEITPEENDGTQSSTFIRDEEGNTQQPVDYNDVPSDVIEELVEYIGDGEELSATKEQLEQYVAHEHTFADAWSSNAREHWHPATCEHTDLPSEIRADVAPHTYDRGVVALEPTETEVGKTRFTCTACGYYYEEDIPKLEHTHTWATVWSYDENNHWKQNTCDYTEVLRADEAVHVLGEGVVTQAPTEAEPGVMTYTCSTCPYTKTEDIPALEHVHTWSTAWSFDDNGHWKKNTCTHTTELRRDEGVHIWDNGRTTTPATHMSLGVTTYTCTVCGHTRTEDIAKLEEHEWSAWVAESTNGTHHSRTCPCGAGERAEHAWDEGVVTTQPTHTQYGIKTYTCETCRHTRTEDVAKITQHEWGSWTPDPDNGEQHIRVCACGATENQAHAWDDGVEGIKPTGKPAIVFTCTACQHVRYDVVPHQHVYGAGVPGSESSVFTCLYCDEQVTYAGHICEADPHNGTFNEHHHWLPCKTAGCPAQLAYGAHEFSNQVVIQPTHDTIGLRADVCACGYRDPGSEKVFEFVDIYLYFDEACGQPNWTIQEPNQMLINDTFRYTMIKVYGLYTDSFAVDNDEVLLNEDGTPVYGRILNLNEYAFQFLFRADLEEDGELDRSSPDLYMDQGRHEIRVHYLAGGIDVTGYQISKMFKYTVLLHEEHTPGYRVEDEMYHELYCTLNNCLCAPQMEEHRYEAESGATNITEITPQTHTKACTCCSYEQVEDHIPANPELQCGEQYWCMVCWESYGEVKQHRYTAGSYDANDENHWQVCLDCGDREESTRPHDFDDGMEHPDPETSKPAILYICSTCHYEKYELIDMSIFELDSVRYEEEQWEDMFLPLSESNSKEIYIVRDYTGERGFNANFTLPMRASEATGLENDLYEMTWNLNGHYLRISGFSSEIGEGATFNITARDGGMLATGGEILFFGDSYIPVGTIHITGGLFDFDPSAFIPTGYTVEMLEAPGFVLDGAEDDYLFENYADLLARYGSYGAILDTRMNSGLEGADARDAYILMRTGLWIVYPEGTNADTCDHTGYTYIWSGDTQGIAYCSLCGEASVDHTHVAIEGSQSCYEPAECAICNRKYGRPRQHDTNNSYSLDANSHAIACSACGERLDTEAHKMGEWYEKTPATATAHGVEARNCTVCRYEETRVVYTCANVNGNYSSADFEFVESREEDGVLYTTYRCKVCGATYTKEEPISA